MSNGLVVQESYTIRQVSSIQELREAFAIIGAQFTPPIPPGDRRLNDLERGFPRERSLMLVGEGDWTRLPSPRARSSGHYVWLGLHSMEPILGFHFLARDDYRLHPRVLWLEVYRIPSEKAALESDAFQDLSKRPRSRDGESL